MSSRTLLDVLYTGQRGCSDSACFIWKAVVGLNGEMADEDTPLFVCRYGKIAINLPACGWRLRIKITFVFDG